MATQVVLPDEITERRCRRDAGAHRSPPGRRWGRGSIILGHHYQRDEVIRHADFTGDSFKLAQHAASKPEAEFIVFCGVHFMAESADILSADHQKVILPDLTAGCTMADMAETDQVEDCWERGHGGRRRRHHARDVHELDRGPEGVRGPPRRRRLHVVERASGARLGLPPEDARAVLPRPAPRTQHRLPHGHPARGDAGLGSRTSGRAASRRSSSARRRSCSGRATARSTTASRPRWSTSAASRCPACR